MIGTPRADRPAGAGEVLRLALAAAGLAACLTLLFLGMRAVMDVGGACADGGPYVPVQPCPEGAPAAMLVGILGLFVFGGLGMVAGARLGGGWAALPLLAWPALFGSLGFNFLDFGLLSPPEGETVVWGWIIPGIVFELMALGPLAITLAGRGSATGRFAPNLPRGPGRDDRPVGYPPRAPRGDPAAATRDVPGSSAGARRGSGGRAATMDSSPAQPEPGHGAQDPTRPPFVEGTQALLERLERLADLRERGLLAPAEYETAKLAVIRELEARR